MKRNKKINDIALISIGSVLLALFSIITIPAPVPFTLQLFGIALLLMTFGGKRGTASIIVYIALGACGVPIFSGFGAGITTLIGPTGGFLFGFVAMGLLYTFCEKRFGKSDRVIITSLAVGTLLCYILGTAVFMIWSGANCTFEAILSALSVCVFPCIIPDALKIYLAHRIYKISLSKLKV